MNDILFEILKAVVIVAVMVVTRYVVPWIKSKISESQYAVVVALIETAVAAAEQTITAEGSGEEKKAQVLEYVQTELAERGITITDEQLDTLIEAAVYALNAAE